MPERRILYADRRPYIVPETLDELCGPTTGIVELPKHLDWSEQGRYNLDDRRELALMYEVVIREASNIGDLRSLLDGGQVESLWAQLYLPRPARSLWEASFPALGRAAA